MSDEEVRGSVLAELSLPQEDVDFLMDDADARDEVLTYLGGVASTVMAIRDAYAESSEAIPESLLPVLAGIQDQVTHVAGQLNSTWEECLEP